MPVTTVPLAKRAAAALLAVAAVLAGCSSDDGPSVQDKLVQSARSSETGDTSYVLPPLSRPPEFGARPDVDTDGTFAADGGPTVFRAPGEPGQDIPPRIAQLSGLSDGSRAFLAKAVPAEASSDGQDRAVAPELIERLATGGDVTDAGSEATGGRQIEVERQTGWFD